MRAYVKAFMTILFVLCFLVSGCSSCKKLCACNPQKQVLFNGKNLDGWVCHLEDETVDPESIWLVKDGVLLCTGETNGYIRTEASYENYRLHVEWRWVLDAYNSGVLVHIQGEDKVWPKCIECQLWANKAGDFVLMQHTGITIDGQDRMDPDKAFVILDKMEPTSEKPLGQWNSYDIECTLGSMSCSVNGVLQNMGTNPTVTSGKIALQSEGGPIEFRNIYLEPIE